MNVCHENDELQRHDNALKFKLNPTQRTSWNTYTNGLYAGHAMRILRGKYSLERESFSTSTFFLLPAKAPSLMLRLGVKLFAEEVATHPTFYLYTHKYICIPFLNIKR